MRIFEYDGEKFVVTEYWPNDKKLSDFKFEQITSIPEDERVLSAEREINSYSIKMERHNVYFEELLYKESSGKYHKIECSKLSLDEQGKILGKYIGWNGLGGYQLHALESPYNALRPTYRKDRIDFSSMIDEQDKKTLRKLKYFLTSGVYLTLDNRTTARMEGIININEKLYIYHLLENEQFDKLNGKNIDEQLELFDNPIIICELDANKVNEFDVTLNKIGITTSETNYNKLMKKSKECEKVLQKLKK